MEIRRFIINLSLFYYEGWAVADSPAHWCVRDGRSENGPTALEWVSGNLAPEDAILDGFLTALASSSARSCGSSRTHSEVGLLNQPDAS